MKIKYNVNLNDWDYWHLEKTGIVEHGELFVMNVIIIL